MPHNDRVDVAVVGGGIIGLAIAWRARARGMSVTLLEREQTGSGTSRVAAGMLARWPRWSSDPRGGVCWSWGCAPPRMWPAFAAELESAGGVDVGLSATGTLLLARDDDDARELERQLEFRQVARVGRRTPAPQRGA